MPPTKRAPKSKTAETYTHPEADSRMRPEVGTQARFKKKKPPQTYRYDSSLSPVLEWDGKNPAREAGEALIKELADYGLRVAELANKESSPERDKEIAKLKSQISDAQTRLRPISGPFLHVAAKVIDQPVNELLVAKSLQEAGN